MVKRKGLEIDRRVGIALSVLPPSQRNAVERIISSPTAFARATTPGRVQQLHASGQPLSMIRVSPSLRLIYTTVGDTVCVLDLVERATLDHFALRKAAREASKSKGGQRRPKAIARNPSDPIEK